MERCDLQSRATQTTQTLHGDKLVHARSKSVYPSAMQVDQRQGLAVPELPRSGEKELAMINLKRAYDPATSTDGIRLLVERLWPRGVKKTSLRIKGWLKDVAPSTELRKWFSHDPAKWDQFRSRMIPSITMPWR